MKRMLADEIRKLSQAEGLNDSEIAKLLGYSRMTIQRIRQRYNIPTKNLDNRKDKEIECARCGTVEMIPRKERRRKYCSSCRK